MEKLLELENVSYSYQDGKEKNKILEHVSYSFEKGKIYAVVGVSGSGKSLIQRKRYSRNRFK